MGEHYSANQVLGRTQTIGCVAVEITQRCNLDCTLCYLSESAESVADIPIEEIFRRLDAVVEHYGTGVHVQITGGDPTLRKHTELVEIVQYASEIGLYPALFTNGIAASRGLLEKLAAAGLQDVAFHVDTTQERKGYATEHELNAIRQEYLDRAKGLGLMVIFNTTIHRGNFEEIPQLVQFFIKNSSCIGLCSFQLQADTGRGEWRKRDVIINQESVRKCIEDGVSRQLPWGIVKVGHEDCHSYMPTWVVNKKAFPVIDDRSLFEDFLRDFQSINGNRHSGFLSLAINYGVALLAKPAWILRLARYLFQQLHRMSTDLFYGKGRVHKLSFFIQNFMDKDQLVQERIDACSFMVMTAEGPVSMCKHNASRDDYILKPVKIFKADGSNYIFEPIKNKTVPRQQNDISRSV